ncbi:CHAD domain-containing protein [Synechococcus sp. Nb3U1]|uniref:CHAD domain-containing protein n=1 Tax=Synechococcus sp. Nb3U1 TaxID=1914529 RepID=UPI001F1EB91F|nr:CHAD domain-containing protein [Synechococcus sp. Nb3U1]MCF2970674.1 CHAD domain-containing protein [Synechococcus sp. Nb3U1]
MKTITAEQKILLSPPSPPTLGSEAHQLLSLQWQRLQKHVERVLSHHPEAAESLHQIRVALRRIGTWVQVFQSAVKLPASLKTKRLQKLASLLGKQRDLDVLIEILQEPCWNGIPEAQQVELKHLIKELARRQAKAQERSRRVLKDPTFLEFQAACEQWLSCPRYTPQAQLPLKESLPHLLTPLLAEWLLQPGWRIPAFPEKGSQTKQLHKLRKATKRLRYQMEFFSTFYGEAVQNWTETLKQLQEQLGRFNDLQVLRAHLDPDSGLQSPLQDQQRLALHDWPQQQHRYLSPDEQWHLYQRLLIPTPTE